MVLGELVTAEQALGKLLDSPLRASVAFRVGKLSKEVAIHMETFQKVRQELLEKYGTEVEDDNAQEGQVSYEFKNGTQEKFNKEIMELLEEEIEKLKVKKFKLKDIEDAGLTARELMSIEWLISDK
jgi:predicted transcriptional regulator